jgi:hypothetical protein
MLCNPTPDPQFLLVAEPGISSLTDLNIESYTLALGLHVTLLNVQGENLTLQIAYFLLLFQINLHTCVFFV